MKRKMHFQRFLPVCTCKRKKAIKRHKKKARNKTKNVANIKADWQNWLLLGDSNFKGDGWGKDVAQQKPQQTNAKKKKKPLEATSFVYVETHN